VKTETGLLLTVDLLGCFASITRSTNSQRTQRFMSGARCLPATPPTGPSLFLRQDRPLGPIGERISPEVSTWQSESTLLASAISYGNRAFVESEAEAGCSSATTDGAPLRGSSLPIHVAGIPARARDCQGFLGSLF